MNEWLDGGRSRLAEATSAEPSQYDLSPAAVERLLELARIASQESGERTNAPLICYLVGLAQGRHPDHGLDELIAAVTRPETA